LEIDKGAGGSNNGGITLEELGADIADPGTNKDSIFAKENGSGKTSLYARFDTRAVVEIVAEPF